MKRRKLKNGYRVEIRIRAGLLRRSRGFGIWEAFEYDRCSSIGRCMSEQKAIALYKKLVDAAFPKLAQLAKKLEKGGAS